MMNREKPKDILSIDEIVDCVGKLDASGLQLDTILGSSSSVFEQQHQILGKLNMQAHLEAQNQVKENVVFSIIAQHKAPALVYHLLLIDAWKTNVYPLIAKDLAANDSVKTYFLLYHEATIVNLLELLLYHQESIAQLEDYMIDLVDYCFRKFTFLNVWDHGEENPIDLKKISATEAAENNDLTESKTTLDFSIAINTLSIFRYLTDAITKLPLGAMSRILNHHDMPCTLVYLVEKAPWLKTIRNAKSSSSVGGGTRTFEKFEDGRWRVVSKEDVSLIGKVEAQIWLSLYNLLVEPECQKKYSYNPHNHSIILRLRGYLNEDVFTQLPVLESLYRYTEQLSMMDPPNESLESNKVLVEEMSETLDKIFKNSDFSSIAKSQAKFIRGQSIISKQQFTNSIASMYDISQLESFLEDPKCAKCGQMAMQRCSRCKLEWYCSRPCQVKGWSSHKQICDTVFSSAGQNDQQQKLGLAA